jgi:type III secretory pathway component EscV
MHPLLPDLTKLNLDELNNKYGDLLKRVTYAYQTGRPDMVQQLQMLLQDYQAEIQVRNAKALEDMEKQSKKFKNIIDIQ